MSFSNEEDALTGGKWFPSTTLLNVVAPVNIPHLFVM